MNHSYTCEHHGWKIVGDELHLKSADGLTIPSADQIYACILENEAVFDGIQPGPPEGLGKLEFSKYPAHLVIQVDYRPADAGTGLFCEVQAVSGRNEAVIHNFNTRKSDHIILNGKWYPFAPGSIQQIKVLLKEADVKETGEISFKDYLNLRKIAQDNDIIQDKTLGQIVHPGISLKQDENALRLFDGTLYPYQVDGWQWLGFLCQQKLGGILADEMGLGKTVQIIAALASPDREKVVPSLIVAPSTLLENWRREIKKFSPTLRVTVHQGPKRTGLPATLADNDIVITSYDTVVRDGALFDMVGWKVVVLDEAQAIKNPKTRRSSATKMLKRDIGIAVTGTPIENKLLDLWSIVDFIHPGYLGDEKEFEDHFGEGVDGGVALEPYVSPLMLRRRVKEVAQDLPERIDVPQILRMEDADAEEYEEIRREILDEYGKSATFVALTKLRMFCTHPMLIEGRSSELANPAEFRKFRRLLEIIEEIFDNSEKVLVFTSYNRMSDLIVDEAKKIFGVYANTIDGRTPIPDRQNIVDRFSSENGPALLALNPRAAGAGLNITAANHVIHYNLEWNPAIEDQASARAYRRGQDKPVTVHRLFFADTVEEVIDQRLGRKREVADAAVVGVSGKEEEYKDILSALQCSPSEK